PEENPLSSPAAIAEKTFGAPPPPPRGAAGVMHRSRFGGERHGRPAAHFRRGHRTRCSLLAMRSDRLSVGPHRGPALLSGLRRGLGRRRRRVIGHPHGKAALCRVRSDRDGSVSLFPPALEVGSGNALVRRALPRVAWSPARPDGLPDAAAPAAQTAHSRRSGFLVARSVLRFAGPGAPTGR